MDYKVAAFLLIILSLVTNSLQVPCQKKRLGAKTKLRLLRRNFLFVAKSTVQLPVVPVPRRRIARDVLSVDVPGTTLCPWTWVQEWDLKRVPRVITKAECRDCKHYCHAVTYTHRVLTQQCDVVTGERVWRWSNKKLPIVFVYKP